MKRKPEPDPTPDIGLTPAHLTANRLAHIELLVQAAQNRLHDAQVNLDNIILAVELLKRDIT